MFNQFGIPVYNSPSIIGNNIIKNGIFSKINWSSLLTNTQKTLNVVNQAIPLYYQVKPVFSNIKNLNKISKEFSKTTINTNNTNTLNNFNKEKNSNPTFFM